MADPTHAHDALRERDRDVRVIIDAIPAMAWSADPDGSATFFNRHYLEILGLSTQEACGWGWTAAVHPEDMDGLAAVWQRCLGTGEPGEAEARLRRHDGEYRWFLFRANPLRDAAGNIVQWYGVNTDIEDRKRAEADLRRAYDHLTEAQRLSKTGSFTADPGRREYSWSEEFYRICGIEPGASITLGTLQHMTVPEDVPVCVEALQRSMSGVEAAFECRIVTPQGAVKHLRGIAHRMEHIRDRAVIMGAVQDITAIRNAEAALNEIRAELAHVSRVTTLSTLTASITHEVNQPLSGIIANAGTCLRVLTDHRPNLELGREAARRIIRDGNRAAAVVARLRDMFGRREFALQPMDLNEATREVIALSLGDLQRERVTIQPELADDLPAVNGDRIQLQQVVLNLVRNASEAMADVHDRPRQLLIRTERDGADRVRLGVRDAGVGVPPECRGKLFDAFFTTKRGGMGIGLSVSRTIIERHQGRLWAEPNAGAGVTFFFSLPVASGGASRTEGETATPGAPDTS